MLKLLKKADKLDTDTVIIDGVTVRAFASIAFTVANGFGKSRRNSAVPATSLTVLFASVGVGAGSLLGSRILKGRISAGIAPWGALGIALKIEDGNPAALYAVTAELLAVLDIGSAQQRAALDGFHAPKRLNTMGIEIGKNSFIGASLA